MPVELPFVRQATSKAVGSTGDIDPDAAVLVHLHAHRRTLRTYQTAGPAAPSAICWIFHRLTSRSLASSRWLTPLASSSRTYTFCCSVRTVGHPGEWPSVRAVAWAPIERSLIEFRQGPELHSRPVQALDHLQAVGQPLREAVDVGVRQGVSPSTTRSTSSRRAPRIEYCPWSSRLCG